MFCYGTGYDEYNCAECVLGDVQRSHTPCNCNPGTTPTIGNFCTSQAVAPVPVVSRSSLLTLVLLLSAVSVIRLRSRSRA
jgi:hypothetical protein